MSLERLRAHLASLEPGGVVGDAWLREARALLGRAGADAAQDSAALASTLPPLPDAPPIAHLRPV